MTGAWVEGPHQLPDGYEPLSASLSPPAGAERTYTLEEAKTELARQECARYGHDYSVISSRGLDGSDCPVSVQCDRCREHWAIKAKDKP